MATDLILVHDHLEGVILAWLAEHIQESKRTASTYGDFLANLSLSKKTGIWQTKAQGKSLSFRQFLRQHGHDLDSEHAIIALHAQAWASLSNTRNGQPVSASTHNLKLAAVASFYEYAIRHERFNGPNPIDRVKRMKRQLYTGAHALAYSEGELLELLEAIPAKTLNGMRDKAMLYLALFTGRRLSEIAALNCGDIEALNTKWVIVWRRTKGNKSIVDELKKKDCPAIEPLSRWLRKFYGAKWPSGKAVFPSLSRHNYGEHMSAQGVEERCKRWLDTSRFHRLRHTFSAMYLDSGGTVQGLSQRLGHSNLTVTTTYVQKLHEGKNDQMAQMRDVFEGKKRS